MSLNPALVWGIIGAALIAVEAATTQFVLVFFGVGALFTALLTVIGVTPGIDSQLLVFGVSSSVLLVALRKPVKKMFSTPGGGFSGDLGQRCKTIKPIAPGSEGAVEYRGSVWDASSDDAELIPEGTTVEIVGIEGIRLKVKRV